MPAYLYKSGFLLGCFSGFPKPVVISVFGETALPTVFLYSKARTLPVSKSNHPVLQADLSCNKFCVHSTPPGLKNVKSVPSTFSTLSQIRCVYSRDVWFTMYTLFHLFVLYKSNKISWHSSTYLLKILYQILSEAFLIVF